MKTPPRLTRTFCGVILSVWSGAAGASEPAAPLVIGETFTIDSRVLDETRRINVYLPPGYHDSRDARFASAIHARWRNGGGFSARRRPGAGVGGQRHNAAIPARGNREH